MVSAHPQFGQHPPARRVIVHLSDTHLLAGNRPLGGRYDTAANLTATLAAVEAAGGRVTNGPYEFPGGRRFHFADPSGNELGVWQDAG